MPTMSKIAKHGVVLSAAGVGLGSLVYLSRELAQSGSTRDYWNVLAAGSVVLGLGGGVLFYACRQMGCECVSDSPVATTTVVAHGDDDKSDPSSVAPSSVQLKKSYAGGLNAISAYVLEHTRPHPLAKQLLNETMQSFPKIFTMSTGLRSSTFLTILAQAVGAQKAIDVGVFTGMSTLAMGLGMGGRGRIVCCELNDGAELQLAHKYWSAAGIAGLVDLRIQPAAKSLQELIDGGESGTFDLVFIDADKGSYSTYFDLSCALLRKGGLMVVDNTLWKGRVVDAKINDSTTTAIRQFNEVVRNDQRVRCLQLMLGDGTTLVQKL